MATSERSKTAKTPLVKQIAERILDGDVVAGRQALTAHIDGSRRVAIDRASRALSMAGIVMALRA